jgi:cytochrome c oxidase subunit II
MDQWIPFWPKNAGLSATLVDAINIGEFALVGLILILVFGTMAVFCIKYRNGSPVARAAFSAKSWRIEITWVAGTLIGFFVLFGFGANAYLVLYQPPQRTELELFIVGKQWMWKVQHPGGQREINAMHIPVDRSIRLVLASEDVVHSFYLPEFRIKHDVVPGQFQAFWLHATRTGTFRLQCSEFCGTGHAQMLGTVTVMPPADYARWLSDQGVTTALNQRGETLFREHGCDGCHADASTAHAPTLRGLYGSNVQLSDGSQVHADERYIHDSILLPQSQIVAGYAPVMPSFAGQIGKEDLIALIAYIQSPPAAPEPTP